MLEIHVAEENEFEKIKNFYNDMIDEMADMKYKPGWKKGLYPDDDYLRAAIQKRELYAAIEDGLYAAAMILNHECNEEYRQVHWKTEAKAQEATVIHTLGVLPTFQGKGISDALLEKAFSAAKTNCQKAIRLDVLKGNIPAERFYIKAGFQYITTIQMFYEDTGLTDFNLYEYALS